MYCVLMYVLCTEEEGKCVHVLTVDTPPPAWINAAIFSWSAIITDSFKC